MNEEALAHWGLLRLVCVGANFCKSSYSIAYTKFKPATGILPNGDIWQIARRLLVTDIHFNITDVASNKNNMSKSYT